MLTECTRAIVYVSGGVVQGIRGDGDNLNITVLDMDNKGGGDEPDEWFEEMERQYTALPAALF